MFNIVVSPTYTWPVKVELPAAGGKFETATFDAEFKRLSAEEVTAMQVQAVDPETDATELARGLLVGWSGVRDADGDIPFSDGAVRQAMRIHGVAGAIVRAFFESVMGATRKN